MNCFAAFLRRMNKLLLPEPEVSFFNIERPPGTTVDMININIMTIIIPPIQCVSDLHNKMLVGQDSMSAIIDAPVVVKPLVDSKIASTIFIPEIRYGRMPKKMMANQRMSIIRSSSTGRRCDGILKKSIKKLDITNPKIIGHKNEYMFSPLNRARMMQGIIKKLMLSITIPNV